MASQIFHLNRDPIPSDIIDLGMNEKDMVKNDNTAKVWILMNGVLQIVPVPKGGSSETLVCDRDPTIDEPLEYGLVQKNSLWENTTTRKFFRCYNDTPAALIWDRITVNSNVNIPRSYSPQSLSFGVERIPNINNDVFVTVSTQMSLTSLQSSTISFQIDSGSGFINIANITSSLSTITKVDVISFIVPAGSKYKLVSSGTGINSIISASELVL